MQNKFFLYKILFKNPLKQKEMLSLSIAFLKTTLKIQMQELIIKPNWLSLIYPPWLKV